MIQRDLQIRGVKVLVLGLAFKENCPDLRNTRVIDIVAELAEYGLEVDVHDPWVNARDAVAEYGVSMVEKPAEGAYDAIILAVAHQQFRDMGVEAIKALGKTGGVFFDVKAIFPKDQSDFRL
jgi:UDP-N-acetyl-D-galactosamine dehydrogenase